MRFRTVLCVRDKKKRLYLDFPINCLSIDIFITFISDCDVITACGGGLRGDRKSNANTRESRAKRKLVEERTHEYEKLRVNIQISTHKLQKHIKSYWAVNNEKLRSTHLAIFDGHDGSKCVCAASALV